ncbi:MAG: ATP-binding protein [Bacteroidales bacterium]|nr:ATP-binding protein [Bacteroidales bacterium]
MSKSEIIGRKREMAVLQDCYDSERAEFVAVYGRRRIGKTFLVKQYFDEKFDFYISGAFGVSKKDQLYFFAQTLSRYTGVMCPTLNNWQEAFDVLRSYLESLKKEKVVVFIDELPWMDTPKSNFIRSLELFWNMWGSSQKNLKLIVCGSATTWMINKLLGDKGGLHNRVTRRICLNQFSLSESEEYLRSIGCEWSRKMIMQCYMTVGGTPFYLSMMDRTKSLDQNIDYLFFSGDAPLRSEYEFLFRSLFGDAQSHRRVIELIAKKSKGLSRQEITQSLKIRDNGGLTEVLDNLIKCDFVRSYCSYGKLSRDMLYQLTDQYILFYLRFVRDYKGQNTSAWSTMSDNVKNTWSGYAFEQVCLRHIDQIKLKLGIAGIAADVYSWSGRNDGQGGQIDMLIDRGDKVINICEMKYADGQYEITKQYEERLLERREMFRKAVRTSKTLHLTMVTTMGVKRNVHSGVITNEVVMDDLFNN